MDSLVSSCDVLRPVYEGYELRQILILICSTAARGLLLSLFVIGQFALAAENPSELLDRGRAELMSEISRQSRYTCVQDIKRDFYDSDSKAPHTCSDVD